MARASRGRCSPDALAGSAFPEARCVRERRGTADFCGCGFATSGYGVPTVLLLKLLEQAGAL